MRGTRGQLLAFGLIYTAYVSYYIAQKNYAFWLQALIEEEGWKQEQAGAFGSAFQISSGISKLFNGPVVDAFSPTLALAGSLMVISVSNGLMFRFSQGATINLLLWTINGVFQGVGWPALARIFISWFPDPKTRGTWYSILSTNQNVGSTLVPLLLPACMKAGGWKAGLSIPAMVSLIVSIILFALLKDSPTTGQSQPEESKLKTKKSQPKPNTREEEAGGAWKVVLIRLGLLGMAYFFISIIRQGIADWSNITLKEEMKFSKEQSSQCLVMYETGAFIGGLAGGIASDYLFSGRRGPVMCLFSLLSTPLVYLAFCFDHTLLPLDSAVLLPLLYALIGFCTFAPHVLIGLFARELAPKNASTAGGFVKAVGQLGGAFAGAPLSMIAGMYGWQAVAYLYIACGGLAAACFLPLVGVEVPVSVKKKRE
ncbi:hypothetical protein AAMO2058_001216300 [Amorphochlora amoebiformis]